MYGRDDGRDGSAIRVDYGSMHYYCMVRASVESNTSPVHAVHPRRRRPYVHVYGMDYHEQVCTVHDRSLLLPPSMAGSGRTCILLFSRGLDYDVAKMKKAMRAVVDIGGPALPATEVNKPQLIRHLGAIFGCEIGSLSRFKVRKKSSQDEGHKC